MKATGDGVAGNRSKLGQQDVVMDRKMRDIVSNVGRHPPRY